jgi:hypothetical protein
MTQRDFKLAKSQQDTDQLSATRVLHNKRGHRRPTSVRRMQCRRFNWYLSRHRATYSRRVSMDIGESDSQVRVIIHDRNGNLNVQFGASNERLRQELQTAGHC